MKSLTRLRLINWHLFANEDIDIKNITFLTGANGTGKSTIIDAIQTVLLADTTGRNFNKAANDRTGRTLRGYLRCETGETANGEIMCLRPGRFTSYVALEFFDDKTNENFTLGIVFDSFEDDSEEHHFFYLKSKFPTNDFTNKDLIDKEQARPLTYKELVKVCTESYKPEDFKFFDSNLEYREAMKHILGDLPEKFFSLFKKAVGFSPITNISSFITEFVCDVDYNVDIAPMQTNIQQYKLLELEAKKIQTKIDMLNDIKTAYEDFNKVKESLALADYVINRANYECAKADIDKLKENLDKNTKRINQIVTQLSEMDSQVAELNSERESFLAKKLGSKGYSISATLSSKKNQALEKIADIENNFTSITATLNGYISEYKVSLDGIYNRLTTTDLSFLTDDEKESVDSFKEVSKEFADTSIRLVKGLSTKEVDADDISLFQSEMASVHELAINISQMLKSSIYSLSSSRDSLDREIQQIHMGHKPFNEDYIEVRSALEATLQERHTNAKVYSFCDMIDIRDKRWTKAIEAVIFNQKFNFFVADSYFEEAAKLMAKICHEYGVYAYSVVDSNKLIQRGFDAKAGSVAEEIITDDEGARAYANFLLGNVKKCETFSEARESGNGLMVNCTGYRNFASFYLNQRKAEMSFIGTKLDEDSVLSKKDDFSSINKKLDCYNDLNSYFDALAHKEILSTSEANTFKSDIKGLSKIDSLNSDIDHFEQEMHEGDLNEVSAFDAKISQIDEDIKNIQAEREKLVFEQGGLDINSKNITNDLIPNRQSTVDLLGQKLLTYDPNLVAEKFSPFFEKAGENLPLTKIRSDAQTHFVQTQNKMKSSKDTLINKRSKYVATYNLSYDASKEDSNEEFDKELDNLSSVQLPNYLAKIEEAHNKATKEFRDDFIYKLRNSFETISSQIDELNQALTSVRFGRDSYRFSVEPNKDFIDYYNMITDDLLLNVGDAEDVYLEKYKDVMASLFNLISESTTQTGDMGEQIINNVAKFTDYRTYLVFDLLVKRGNDEKESSLARTFKRQSGGETQTPFYISILASFAQLYRTSDPNSDTLRLVIFDEAFSKMDGTRIKESVGLLRSFGLQAILSTPSEKLRDLSKEVDLVLVTIHDPKKTRSYLDRYEDKEKRDAYN